MVAHKVLDTLSGGAAGRTPDSAAGQDRDRRSLERDSSRRPTETDRTPLGSKRANNMFNIDNTVRRQTIPHRKPEARDQRPLGATRKARNPESGAAMASARFDQTSRLAIP